MATIAFGVLDSGSLDANLETPFKDRMDTTLGHTVNLVDDADLESYDYSSTDAIVISNKVAPPQFNGLKSQTTPLLFMRSGAVDDLSLGTGADTWVDDEINIVDNTHYISSTLSTGDIVVYSSIGAGEGGTGWSNDVNDLAQEKGTATTGAILEIDKDETLVDSSTAAERRVFYGLERGDKHGANGWTLFDRAIGWLLYEDAAAESGSADLSANVTIRNKAQFDLSANTTIRNKSQADLSASVTIQNKNQNDLSANVTIRNKGQYDLSSNATIRNKSTADLSANVTIQNKSQYDISANVTIQKTSQADLSGSFTITNTGQADLSSNITIQNKGQFDLSASFTITTDAGYITLADALIHNIPISSQTHTIELSNSNLPKQLNYQFSMHNIVVTAAIHDIELSDQTHQIVISSEPLK